MAHQLSNESGKVEMAYAGEKPWHRLGMQVPGLMTTKEALQASHLDWIVSKISVLSSYDLQPVKDAFTVIRDDTKRPLGIVGKRYEPIQNQEAFSFFDMVLGEGQGQIDTIGALGNGERVWCLAKMPEVEEVLPGDPVERYLLVWNSHDGSKGLEVMFTNIRVVCNNTLTAALRDSASKVSIRHTSNWRDKAQQAHLLLNQSRKYWEDMKEINQYLAKTSVSRVEVGAFLENMFPTKETDSDRSKRSIQEQKVKVLELAEVGRGADIPGVRGSAWGLWNAYTEFLDYERPIRGGKERWERTTFDTTTASLRANALNALI